MSTPEQIADEISQLPEALQREVLDFAHFLKTRSQQAERSELEGLAHAQESSLDNEWNNEDDEVWNDVPTR
ncbi:Protein of unknown function [Modicisalibacter ilicicola DSM 19980]|uniref:DUF2281 domain-containing protein n=1 Tax=Modicisalibacter ilicicola DSM 19980 TaxID=1121942 RepID=A0A1M4SXV8_9GAMM|nr:DUF2281 domain-containing protein [Halomonas ilicicola]SHE37072.1 Protein of unknown function [Halomonas ilicicola DSM 19980]